MNLSQYFDKAVCMCLDLRQPVWDTICGQFRHYGLYPEQFIMGKGFALPFANYDWLDDLRVPQTYNYTLAVQNMVRRVKKSGSRSLFVCEDDVHIHDDFVEIVTAAMMQIEKHAICWDILYLGANRTLADYHQLDENLLEVQNTFGFFAVGLSCRIFDAILSLKPAIDTGIDGLISKHLQQDFRVYSVYPNVIDQIPGVWSFSTNCYSDAMFQQSWRKHKGLTSRPCSR